MLHFDSDYMEGAHPLILERLQQINLEQNTGYGLDEWCASAKNRIREACECPDADVHFLVGGTQANKTVIASILRTYQGVIAVDSGHIAVHEAGAVEMTGHKVLTIPGKMGKLDAADLKKFLEVYWADETCEHMVMPGMVYISHPTEVGTLYTKAELEAIHAICQEYQIPLYVDGARLGYGLAAEGTDVTLPVLAQLCDAFYIGGTKVGALFGEALVVPDKKLLPHFFSQIKQHGALMAKGWLLGVQFDVLFTDGLYKKIGAHAIGLAMKLKKGMLDKGYELFMDSATNQQFVILTNEKLAELREKVTFNVWAPIDEEHTAVRFVTSWATKEENVDTLLALL